MRPAGDDEAGGVSAEGRRAMSGATTTAQPEPTMIRAPFTVQQVEALNRYQTDGVMAPFTCGQEPCELPLVATEAGWQCPTCAYTEDWAHGYMVEDRR